MTKSGSEQEIKELIGDNDVQLFLGEEDSEDVVSLEPDEDTDDIVALEPPTQMVKNEQFNGQNQVSFSWAEPIYDEENPVIDYSIEMFDSKDGIFKVVASGVIETYY